MEHNLIGLETLTNCPLCSGSQFKQFIFCKDFTVSHETFQIVQCETCGLKFTNSRPQEEVIAKYYQSSGYISHSNTSKGIINSLYQIARRFTISKKVNLVKKICPSGKSILDYGSGTGEFLYAMKKTGWDVKGIEPNSEARNYAINNYLPDVYDSTEINSFPEKSFDVITLWHVLEHIHKLNEAIEKFKALLNDHGKLLIAVPNSDSCDSEIYGEVWAAYDVPRHLYHFNMATITQLFKKHQMHIIDIHSMPLDAFYVSMLSEKYKNKSLGIIKGIFSGVKTNLRSFGNKKFSSSLIFIIGKL